MPLSQLTIHCQLGLPMEQECGYMTTKATLIWMG